MTIQAPQPIQGQQLPTSKEQMEDERRRADRLAERLRQLGIDPDSVS